MEARRKISARKVAILYLLDAPDSAGNEPSQIDGTTKLQKLLFLVQDKYKDRLDPNVWDVSFDYVPEKYGPADLDLYQDLEFLEALGYLTTGRMVDLTEEQEEKLPIWATHEVLGDPAFPEESEEEELSFEYLMGGLMEDAIQERSTLERVYAIRPKGRSFLERLEAKSDGDQGPGLSILREACRLIKREYGSWELKELLEFVYRNYPEMITESTIRDRVLGRH